MRYTNRHLTFYLLSKNARFLTISSSTFSERLIESLAQTEILLHLRTLNKLSQLKSTHCGTRVIQ